eukprot:scaffold471_cov235-Pinguiococcus_pyrenoidosus.AAC.6
MLTHLLLAFGLAVSLGAFLTCSPSGGASATRFRAACDTAGHLACDTAPDIPLVEDDREKRHASLGTSARPA